MPPADCRAMAVRVSICGGGEEEMNRRKLPHVVAVGVLATLLALPGPALAAPSRVKTSDAKGHWQWLVKLLPPEFSVMLSGNGLFQKEGPGIDPNGGRSGGTNAPLVLVDPNTSTPTIQRSAGPGI